jgi:hypothetical protein
MAYSGGWNGIFWKFAWHIREVVTKVGMAFSGGWHGIFGRFTWDIEEVGMAYSGVGIAYSRGPRFKL